MEKRPIIKQQISDHPRVKGLKRFVVIRHYEFDTDFEMMKFKAHIEYYDEKGNRDTTFKDEILGWNITNATKTTILNKDGSRRKNPDYNPDIEGSEEFLRMPSYNYFYLIVTDENPKSAVPLVSLLRAYILQDDAVGVFETYELGIKPNI